MSRHIKRTHAEPNVAGATEFAVNMAKAWYRELRRYMQARDITFNQFCDEPTNDVTDGERLSAHHRSINYIVVQPARLTLPRMVAAMLVGLPPAILAIRIADCFVLLLLDWIAYD